MRLNAFENDGDPFEIEETQMRPQSTAFADFLLQKGLYDTIEIEKSNIQHLIDLIAGKVPISCYCKECKDQRVFHMKPMEFLLGKRDGGPYSGMLADELQQVQTSWRANVTKAKNNALVPEWKWSVQRYLEKTRVMVFPYICTMNPNHRLDFVVRTDGNTMTKIGQYPTVADLSFPELDEFKKAIDETSRKELGKAIGLYAHGVGVGSYVYLRRIFERILDNAKTEAEQAGVIDLSGYNEMKVAERIRLLKDQLPPMINSNPVFYSIISKGIHELSEDECLQYFPVLKEAIFLILRQTAQKKAMQAAAKRLHTELSSIASTLASEKG